MSAGIYKIENIVTNKAYIGQSFNIFRRLNAHKNNLLKGCHVNTHCGVSLRSMIYGIKTGTY